MMTSHTSPVDIEQAMPLAEMSVAQIAALPPAQMQEAHTNLLIIIRSPNHLVAELMAVVGLNKQARIVVPKS